MVQETQTLATLRKLCFSKAISMGLTGRDRINHWNKEMCSDFLETGNFNQVNNLRAPEPVQPTQQQVTPTAAPSVPAASSIVNTEPATSAPVSKSTDLADILASALQGKLTSQLNEARVIELITEQLAKRPARNLVISNNKTAQTVKIDRAHKDFEKVLAIMTGQNDDGRRLIPYLVGPAGSGKTTLAKQLAKALAVDFHTQAFCGQSTKTDLLGYTDANSNYNETPTYRAYKRGGVLLYDELDSANANVIMVLNSLLENHDYTFPNGEHVERHADFYCIACANTYGSGRSRDYVGRNELDGASRERFAFHTLSYDTELERELAADDSWVDTVQALRKAVEDLQEKLIVSPRASINGAMLKRSGAFSELEILDMVVFKGCAEDTKSRIMAKAGL